ncbi:MAG: hypothetical protein RIT43_1157 [Bacteroidota bacterium]|jgi:hypothetical protein
MKLNVFLFAGILLLSGCGKIVTDIDFEWAKIWTSPTYPEHQLTIDFDGSAVFKHKNGKTYTGTARYKDRILRIGTKKFIVNQTPTYYGPPLNRWSIQIDNIQMLRY